MNHPVPAAVPSGLPDPERHIRMARLENKITELAAHINAATFQLLKLICEYDEQGALIKKALEGAMDDLFEEQRNEPSDISAETSRRMACDASVVHW